VVVHAWMKEPADVSRPVISLGQGVALGACTLIILWAGLLPERFIDIAGTTLQSQFLQMLR